MVEQVIRGRFHLSAFALGLLSLAGSTYGQDTIDGAARIRTRVVFVDTLVKDKRTGENVTDLTRDDFEILDNGKPRAISYFSRERDDSMRPLALLLILAPMDDGARKNFQRPEVVNSITVALNKLPPEDEVAVMLLWRDGIGRMLTGLTRDRAKVTSVLASLPKYAQTKPVARASRIIQDAALSTAAERPGNINLKRLGAVLAVAYERDLHDFAEFLLLENLGPRTLQSLALVAEVVHGAPARFSDPARFSFAHGGKDRHPFPVPLKSYDESLNFLRTSLEAARLGDKDKLEGFRRLERFVRTVETELKPEANFDAVIAHEKALSPSLDGRSVFDDKPRQALCSNIDDR